MVGRYNIAMEPQEINGGRFYLRPLLHDQRINDQLALDSLACGAVGSDPSADSPARLSVEQAREDWMSGQQFSWAICEQTCVDAVAIARLTPWVSDLPDGESRTLNDAAGLALALTVDIVGDPQRHLPVDPAAPPVTAREAAESAAGTLVRWGEGFLGGTIHEVTVRPPHSSESASPTGTPL